MDNKVKGVEIDPVREKLIELLKESGVAFPISTANFLIANGVTVPPCKVGQEIWFVFSQKHPANPNDKGKYFMIQDGVQRIIYGVKGWSVETWNVGTIPAKEIGKKLFFTKEEAEAALPEPPKGD